METSRKDIFNLLEDHVFIGASIGLLLNGLDISHYFPEKDFMITRESKTPGDPYFLAKKCDFFVIGDHMGKRELREAFSVFMRNRIRWKNMKEVIPILLLSSSEREHPLAEHIKFLGEKGTLPEMDGMDPNYPNKFDRLFKTVHSKEEIEDLLHTGYFVKRRDKGGWLEEVMHYKTEKFKEDHPDYSPIFSMTMFGSSMDKDIELEKTTRGIIRLLDTFVKNEKDKKHIRIISGGAAPTDEHGAMGWCADETYKTGFYNMGITVRDLMVQFSDAYEKSARAFDELIIVPSLEERKYQMTKYADLIFINDKGGLGTVEEILYVLGLIERDQEFSDKKLVIFIFNRSGFWEKSGLVKMLESAGYKEGEYFYLVEDIEELKPMIKECLEKKYEKHK